MSYEIEGRILKIMDTQVFPSGFSKREFVLLTEEKYPQPVKFECVKERCALLDGVAVDDFVKAKFAIRGNEYEGRYYVNLQVFEISKNDPF